MDLKIILKFMKTKQLRDKVVAKYARRVAYETFHGAPLKSTIKNIERIWQKTNLPKEKIVHPNWQAGRGINESEATERPIVTLEELRRSTAEVGICLQVNLTFMEKCQENAAVGSKP